MRKARPPSSVQRHGKAAKVQRLPVTLSRSPPMFSIPGIPFPVSVLCAGSQNGKSAVASLPVCSRYSSSRCGWDGPGPWLTNLVPSG
jgi:hypothetical protein